MDIAKFFNGKKRDSSNNSNKEDGKRQRKESPYGSPKVSVLDTPKTPGDVLKKV